MHFPNELWSYCDGRPENVELVTIRSAFRKREPIYLVSLEALNKKPMAAISAVDMVRSEGTNQN